MLLLMVGINGYLVYRLSISREYINRILKKEVQEAAKDLINGTISFIDIHEAVIEAIFSMRNSPQDWTVEDCTVDNKKLGMSIWTSNTVRSRHFYRDKYQQYNDQLTSYEKQLLEIYCVKLKEWSRSTKGRLISEVEGILEKGK